MHDEHLVNKMIGLVEKIQKYCKDLSYDEFAQDEMLVEACVFNLSQLGETANGITEEFELLHPEISWHEMYGLRNRIVHDYQGVNLKLVWEIIEQDLPILKEELERAV